MHPRADMPLAEPSPAPRAKPRFLTAPNLITALRLPLAAAFAASSSPWIQGVILAAVAVTDGIDGWVARRFGQGTRSGEIFDAVADKIFVLVALVSYAATGRLTLVGLLILLSRDLYATAAFITAAVFRMPIRFRARMPGKVVTNLQILALLVLLIRPGWAGPLIVLIGGASAYAIVDYTAAGLRDLRRKPRTD